MATDVRTPELDFLELGYRSMYRLWEQPRMQNRLYLSDTGKARLAHIHGWLLGLYQAGKQEEAEKLVRDFQEALSFFVRKDEYVEYEYKGRTLKVPTRKAVVHDDGTLHGFSFAMYAPIPPDRYEDRRLELVIANPDWHAVEIYQELVKQFKIAAKVGDSELTEFCWDPNHGQLQVYYSYIFNGGLLYHGPGGGEVFAVRIGDTSRAWSIHT